MCAHDVLVCVPGGAHVCMERLKTDLGVFPSPSSFAEVRSFAKAFPSARLASRLALGSVVSRKATDPPDWVLARV